MQALADRLKGSLRLIFIGDHWRVRRTGLIFIGSPAELPPPPKLIFIGGFTDLFRAMR